MSYPHSHLRGRSFAVAVLSALLLSVTLFVPAAGADERIRAVPQQTYSPSDVTMDQGERLTFQNVDISNHDVMATTNGPGGKPLFSTPVIGQGEEAFVEGSQYLTTGEYGFFCSVHPSMTGTLSVTSAGTPLPRPAPGAPKPPDTTSPAVKVKLRSARAGRVRRARALAVEVTVDEPAKVAITATARVSGRVVKIAKGSVRLSGAGTRRRQLRLTRAGRRIMAKRPRLAVTVTARAVDGAGNKGKATARRTLKR